MPDRSQPTVEERLRPFSRIASADYMRDLLQQRIYGAGTQLVDAQIEYCKRHLSTKLHLIDRSRLDVCFRTRVIMRGSVRTHFVYIKAWLDGRSTAVYNALSSASFTPVKFGSPVTHLRDHDAVAWSFPNDPSLPNLTDVAVAELISSHAQEIAPVVKKDAGPLASSGLSVIRYKPEHHCVTRHEICTERQDASSTYSLFAKTFAESDGPGLSASRLYETMIRMARDFAVLGGSLTVPKALWVDAVTNTVWQSEVSGVAASSVLHAGDPTGVMSLAARGLACVHDGKVSSSHEITHSDLLKEARKKVSKLRLLLPSGAATRKLDDIESLIDAHLPVLSNSPRRMIHGDFHLGQLLVRPQGVGLLDFDDVCVGDPLQDLAEFIVDLHFRSFDSDRVDALIRCLLRAYRDTTTIDCPLECLQWHVRVQCLEKAYHVLGSYSSGAVAACQHAFELALSEPCKRLL